MAILLSYSNKIEQYYNLNICTMKHLLNTCILRERKTTFNIIIVTKTTITYTRLLKLNNLVHEKLNFTKKSQI